MLEAPFGRNRVVLLANSRRSAHDGKVVVPADLPLDRSRPGKHRSALLAKDVGERRVVELAHDHGPEVLALEPGLERSPEGRVAGREEHRRTVERSRKPAAEPARQAGPGKERSS